MKMKKYKSKNKFKNNFGLMKKEDKKILNYNHSNLTFKVILNFDMK